MCLWKLAFRLPLGSLAIGVFCKNSLHPPASRISKVDQCWEGGEVWQPSLPFPSLRQRRFRSAKIIVQESLFQLFRLISKCTKPIQWEVQSFRNRFCHWSKKLSDSRWKILSLSSDQLRPLLRKQNFADTRRSVLYSCRGRGEKSDPFAVYYTSDTIDFTHSQFLFCFCQATKGDGQRVQRRGKGRSQRATRFFWSCEKQPCEVSWKIWIAPTSSPRACEVLWRNF